MKVRRGWSSFESLVTETSGDATNQTGSEALWGPSILADERAEKRAKKLAKKVDFALKKAVFPSKSAVFLT